MTLISSTKTMRNLERMTVELSPFLNEWELDTVMEFNNTISTSKFDMNPSVDDCVGQFKIILGEERYNEVVKKWTEKNQPLLREIGKTMKFRYKLNGTLWDGLDSEDNPDDYEVVYV
jgi:hypothetical protein